MFQLYRDDDWRFGGQADLDSTNAEFEFHRFWDVPNSLRDCARLV